MTKINQEEWAKKAYETVCQVAKEKPKFIPDDIWNAGLSKPEEARALGPVMARCKNDGIIRKTGKVQATGQSKSHGTDVTEWESLIYKEP